MQDLGTLGGAFSNADGLNDEGEVVGISSTADDQSFKGFLWHDGVMTDLGDLDADGCSNAISINAKSQIVGESFSCGGDSHHPYIWENGGPMVDLNTLVSPGSDILVHEPLFISDEGEIAASGDLPDGDQHAVLLIPKEGDDGEAESELATRRESASAVESPAGANHARLTPARMAELRARFGARHRGLGIRPSK
jgi:probable HAF family extracellular repeat protein